MDVSDDYFIIVPSLIDVSEDFVPDRFALHQSRPNPFGSRTAIAYDVPAGGGWVSLKVYDVVGRVVDILVDGLENPGRKTVTWDGTNSHGRRVASGVYFYRLDAPGYRQTRKMTTVE